MMPPYSSAAKAKYKTLYACEDSQLTMDCEQGSKINLIRANFGRFSIMQCNEQGQLDLSTDCMSPITLRIMRERCQDQQNCTVSASNALFGDKCPKTRKYLEVHFQCVKSSSYVNLRNSTFMPPTHLTSFNTGYEQQLSPSRTQQQQQHLPNYNIPSAAVQQPQQDTSSMQMLPPVPISMLDQSMMSTMMSQPPIALSAAQQQQQQQPPPVSSSRTSAYNAQAPQLVMNSQYPANMDSSLLTGAGGSYFPPNQTPRLSVSPSVSSRTTSPHLLLPPPQQQQLPEDMVSVVVFAAAAFVFVAFIAFMASTRRTTTGAALKRLGNFSAFKYKNTRHQDEYMPHNKDLLVINNQNGHQFLYAPANTTKINGLASTTHTIQRSGIATSQQLHNSLYQNPLHNQPPPPTTNTLHHNPLHHHHQNTLLSATTTTPQHQHNNQNTLHHHLHHQDPLYQHQHQHIYSSISNLSGTGGQSNNNYYYSLMGLTSMHQQQQQQLHQHNCLPQDKRQFN